MEANRQGLLLSDDLMFTSRVTGTARELGFAVQAARSADMLLQRMAEQPPACVIVDLANPGLVIEDFVGRLKKIAATPFVVAYGSHVDTATLKAARAAGCDRVMPRSQFVEALPTELAQWFTGG
jgi:DNA-binding response OmpR family regulator